MQVTTWLCLNLVTVDTLCFRREQRELEDEQRL